MLKNEDFNNMITSLLLKKDQISGYMIDISNRKNLECFNDTYTMKYGEEKYSTDNIGHCFSNNLSLDDWMKDDDMFQVLDKDWEEFIY